MSLEQIERALKSYLQDEELKYASEESDEGGSIFFFNVSTPMKFAPNLFYNIVADHDSFYVYASYPDPADKCLAEMAQFLTIVNFGLKFGNFELSWESGEIRYKSFVQLEDGAVPSYDLIDLTFNMPLAMFDKYSPGIAAVLSGELTPQEAAINCDLHDDEENFIVG
ncbi:MAG: hypothetical protein ACI38Q_00435 [Candidatus Bruticola sp.]